MKRNTWSAVAFSLSAGALAVSATNCGLITLIDYSAIGKGDGGAPSWTISPAEHNTPTGNQCPAGVSACAGPESCAAPANECVEATCEQQCCGTQNKAIGEPCQTGVCDGNASCVTCDPVVHCAPQTTACKVNTCAGNKCGVENAVQGTACDDDGGKVCDGDGKCVACTTKDDCPAPQEQCHVATCIANVCGAANAPQGDPCTLAGGKVCDGNGKCVGCNTNGDCGTNACHYSHVCVPPACANGTKDGAETSVDCGGNAVACPPRCPDSQGCLVNSDCMSNICDSLSKTCG